MTWITLGVRDIDSSLDFHTNITRFATADKVQGEGDMRMFSMTLGEVTCVYMQRAFLAKNMGVSVENAGEPCVVLTHTDIFESEGAVDETLRRGKEAGYHTIAANKHPWGVYSGFIMDPDGYCWEIGFMDKPMGEATENA